MYYVRDEVDQKKAVKYFWSERKLQKRYMGPYMSMDG